MFTLIRKTDGYIIIFILIDCHVQLIVIRVISNYLTQKRVIRIFS